jgi:hypothetical protein
MTNPIHAGPALGTADGPRGTPTSDRFAAETAHHHPTADHTTDEEEIRMQAYESWIAGGRPEGKQTEHWRSARSTSARMRPGR